MKFTQNNNVKTVLKGFILAIIPPAILDIWAYVQFSFASLLLLKTIYDIAIFGIGGIIVSLIYIFIIKKHVKRHALIAKIAIIVYYLIFAVWLIVDFIFAYILSGGVWAR